MASLKDTLAGPFSTVESFFDQVKLRYKWRYHRWKHLRIQAYRGHGTQDRLHLRGRVLDDKGVDLPKEGQPLWKNMVDTVRRIETDEIPGARVQLRFQEQTLETSTGEDGFFTFTIHPKRPLPEDRVWHEVTLDLLRPAPDDPAAVRTTGHIEVPPPDAEFGVISDLDDTVVRTGATNKLHMARVVLLNNAHTRTPFEGVGAFYQALRKGPDDKGHNPVFYLSSSPWNLYGLFQHFFEVHNIPLGSIFLKDYGFDENKFFTSGHQQHKLDHIRQLLETYPDLPFVCVGDSGQKDPEIYRAAARDHPDHIRAVFIRDVTPDQRDAEVRAIADEVEDLGVPMRLVETSEEAGRHAAELGLIQEEAVSAIREDKRREEQTKDEPGWLGKLFG